MAATVSAKCVLEVLGLVRDRTVSTACTYDDAPAEFVEGCPVVGTTAGSLDLGDIAAGSVTLLYLEAVNGGFLFKLGATTGTPATTDSHISLDEGEWTLLRLNDNAVAMSGVRYIGDEATTGSFYYFAIGK